MNPPYLIFIKTTAENESFLNNYHTVGKKTGFETGDTVLSRRGVGDSQRIKAQI